MITSSRPTAVYLMPKLPWTYSGSVLRQDLEDLLNGEHLCNTDLLRNPAVLYRIAVEIQHNGTVEDIRRRSASAGRSRFAGGFYIGEVSVD